MRFDSTPALLAPILASLTFATPATSEPAAEAPESGPMCAMDGCSELQLKRGVNRLWAESKPVQHANFLGISTLQNPLDAWIIQEILFEVKPDFVIETGTYNGGSALMWAIYLENFQPRARVITIDIADHIPKRAKKHRAWKQRIEFLKGSSVDPEMVAEVRKRVEGSKVVVILDSLHTGDHVLAELRAYAPLVDVGSYVIVQDTLIGPIQGIQKFLSEDDRFEVDKSRERFVVTNSVRGYLKRVR